MSPTLLRALVLLAPAGFLFWRSLVLYKRGVRWSSLQLVGATCLVMVVLTHVCEALRLFTWMHWGADRSAGHYLDFTSAVLSLTLLPAGYVIRYISRLASGKSSKS